MNIYFSRIERRDFGDLLSVERAVHTTAQHANNVEALLRRPPRGHEILAVWSRNPEESAGVLPSALVCEDGMEGDWAAWITTFGSRIRPFSAFTRLLNQSDLRTIANAASSPDLARWAWPAAGLVLGEVLAASRLSDRALETLPATAFASTLSFSMLRAAAMYPEFHAWRRLIEGWEFVRTATAQRPRSVEGRAVARICAALIGAAGNHAADELLDPSDVDLKTICHELIISSDHTPYPLLRVSEFAAADERMRGSREERVVAFAEFARIVDTIRASDHELVSLMLGYLASRIAPGTIQHATVLEPVVSRFPTAPIWYGFCSGLSASTRSGNVAHQQTKLGLPASARRVLRDLLRPEPVLSSPNCDIALIELVALAHTRESPLEGLITTTQGTAVIELAPAVWTVVSAASRVSSEGMARSARDRGVLLELGEHIDRLRETYSELVSSELAASEDRQGSLFPSRRRKK